VRLRQGSIHRSAQKGILRKKLSEKGYEDPTTVNFAGMWRAKRAEKCAFSTSRRATPQRLLDFSDSFRRGILGSWCPESCRAPVHYPRRPDRGNAALSPGPVPAADPYHVVVVHKDLRGRIEARPGKCRFPQFEEGYRKRSSVLKNSLALFSAPGSGAENDAFVVFWPWFGPLLDRRPGRHQLFQQAGSFSIQ
jgi:hypothetical protein